MRRHPSHRGAFVRAALLAVAAGFALGACAARSPDADVYRRAEILRGQQLAREVARLRADLRQAEEAMVAIESGLRAVRTRADAVSILAEARIAVERASRAAPWREQHLAEAREKLQEAERQVGAGHFGSAVFFSTGAQRIAETLELEARAVSAARDARFVRTREANLRAGPSTKHRIVNVLHKGTPIFPERTHDEWLLVHTPSGHVGWVHTSLTRRP